MSDDMVKQAIIDLQELVRCICSPALKDRNLHSPDCRGYDASNVALLSDRIEELEVKLAKAVKLMELSVELATWNTTLLEDVIDFITELKGQDDE
jgi:hypothetical protein